MQAEEEDNCNEGIAVSDACPYAQHMCFRSSILVQLLALPLPLICTGKGEYENHKNVGNSHDLIAAILGRIMVMSKEKEEQMNKEILFGQHRQQLLGSIKNAKKVDDAEQIDFQKINLETIENEKEYEALCAYTRAVIERLVAIDTGCTMKEAQMMDIRFVRDPGTISRSQHRSLFEHAREFCNALNTLNDKEEESGPDIVFNGYRDCVAWNIKFLRQMQ